MIAPWIYVGIKGSERAKKKQTLDNFEANFLWFKHKIKLMGHGELRFTERESKKRKSTGSNAAPGNGILWEWNSQIIGLFVVFEWSISNRNANELPQPRPARLRNQFRPIYSDHGSYSHIPHWLVNSYLQQRIRDDYDEIVSICHTSTHKQKKQPRHSQSNQNSKTDQWIRFSSNIFTN